MLQATETLYKDGGYTRFYSGLMAALIQGEQRSPYIIQPLIPYRSRRTIRRHRREHWHPCSPPIQSYITPTLLPASNYFRLAVSLTLAHTHGS